MTSRFGFRCCILFIVLSALALASPPLGAVQRRAFATSVQGTAKLSTWPGAGGATGVAAGDNICRARALAAGLPNSSTYHAWLSNAATDAYCHVQGLTGKKSTGCGGAPQPGAGPWFQSNGLTAFVSDVAALTDYYPAIYRNLIWDENFSVLPVGAIVWTGTFDTGQDVPGIDCSGWTSESGSPATGAFGYTSDTVTDWTSAGAVPCNASYGRLLCLEGGTGDDFTPFWAPASLVFVTSMRGSGDLSSWPQAGGASGIAAGDNICRNLAAAAHLPVPDSFVAWLSDGAVDAISRIQSNGPFKRLDGLTLANGKLDLTDGTLRVSFHQDENGRYEGAYPDAYTGTLADGTASGFDCSDWDSEAGFHGTAGGLSYADEDWTAQSERLCSDHHHLYCFSNALTLKWDSFESGDFSRWNSHTP
ncbi:MAG: hypothetical protein AB7G12_14890 [Thermoanaerobaculia bacterium]